MKHLWRRGDWRLEVLKPQVDDGGYDLVLDANAIVRHVQLKSSFRGSTVDKVNVNVLLAAKPSGCVVFMWFDQGNVRSWSVSVLRSAARTEAAGSGRNEGSQAHQSERTGCEGTTTEHQDRSAVENRTRRHGRTGR
jgi:hypothetical protein